MILANELYLGIIFFGKSSINRGNLSLPVWMIQWPTKSLWLCACCRC